MTETQKPEENELEVIFPNIDLVIDGEPITVKEFTFIQSLKAEPIVEAMIPDLRAVFDGNKNEDMEFQALTACFGKHADAYLQLMSISTGKPVEWIAGLHDRDGQLISMAFWKANMGFFTRRVVVSAMATMAHKEVEQLAGEKSSVH